MTPDAPETPSQTITAQDRSALVLSILILLVARGALAIREPAL
jgi:hypothetical protein